MTRRLVHIGQRKTGTTWLQRLGQNADAAGSQRFRFWEIFSVLKEKTWKTVTDEMLDRALSALPDGDGPACLASYEMLIILDPGAVARALARRGLDARILITTRAPQGYLTSSFNNDSVVRGTKAATFTDRFVRNHMARVFDLDARIAAFEAVLGPGSVHFPPYEMLRDAPEEYVGRLSALLGVDLAPFVPPARLNVSPPPEFLLLQRRINGMIAESAPEILAHPDWAWFKLMANFSAGAAAEGLKAYFAGLFAADPIGEGDMPVLSQDALLALAERMAVLRDRPDYAQILPLYGLAQTG